MRRWLMLAIGALVLLGGLLMVFSPLSFKQGDGLTPSIAQQPQLPPPTVPVPAQPTVAVLPLPVPTITPLVIGTVRPLRTPIPENLTEQEIDELKRSHLATVEAQGGRRVVLSGPQTRGSTITIAGRQLALPTDAWIESLILAGTCAGPCPELPLYQIKRGNSTISVGIPTGRINGEQIAPGEEGAFDFLKAALK
jgi:hypothetical protein